MFKFNFRINLSTYLRIALIVVIGILAILPMSTSQAAYGDRITISNKQFMAGGQRIWINGVNTPWKNWNDFGSSYDSAWWSSHFDTLKANKINATRIWITCDGAGAINISSSGFVSGATQAHWNDLDNLFSLAQQKGIYIMATLISHNHFDTTRTNGQLWRNMINNDANIDSFVNNYVATFVNRYKNNPWLWSIDVGNELDQPVEWGATTWAQMQKYHGKVAKYIHENSSILVTSGLAYVKYNTDSALISGAQGNKISDSAIQAQVNSPNAKMDFYSIHWYPWEYQYWGNPFSKSPAAWGMPTDKLNMFGENPGNGIYSASGSNGCGAGAQLIQNLVSAYETSFNNGWEGLMAWSSNGVDCNGDINTIKDATINMYNKYPNLIYPGGGTVPTNTPVFNPPTNTPVVPTATPSGGSSTANYEAEAGTRTGGAQVQSASNASGGQVVGNLNVNNDSVTVSNVSGGAGGAATVVIRFSQGYSSNKSLSLYVNNVKVQQITFAPTGGWNTFASTAAINITLNSGTGNTIKIQKDSSDAAAADIDRFTVTTNGGGTSPTNTPVPPTNTPVPSGSGVLIYGDATTWSTNVGDATLNLNNTSPVYAGTKSMAVDMNGGFTYVGFFPPSAVSTSGRTKITFWVYSATTMTNQVALIANGNYNDAVKPRLSTVGGQWSKVTINLSQLGNPATITELTFNEMSGGNLQVFYVDEWYLE